MQFYLIASLGTFNFSIPEFLSEEVKLYLFILSCNDFGYATTKVKALV